MDKPNFLLLDFRELINNAYFFPNKKMTRNEILNSLVRYSIIIFILFFLIKSNHNWYYVPLGIFIGAVILFLIDLPSQNEEILIKKNTFKCKKPNINNPYMNVLTTQDEQNLPACDPREEDIKTETDKFYKFNLYQNGEDLFDKKHMERQFYTMPSSTIPNKQGEFINWLYKNESNCKINTEMCSPYEDKRYH